ncbi:MAG: hypothetical protein IKQ97_07030 [Eubacterium sp.]|nr:hypothetical protein [Eubacterium sp.]
MAIIERTRKDGEKIYCYEGLDKDELYSAAGELLESVKIYIGQVSDLEYNELSCNYNALLESIVRIDKRKDYFMIFHNDTEVNENRAIALQAYWILKFKPFSIRSAQLSRKYPYVNELIAAFLLLSCVKESSDRSKPVKFNVSTGFVGKLYYAMRYWDLSKEALMLVTEALNE